MHTRIGEIHSFLNHNDHPLAVRRMLDTSLDTGDISLINETVAFSRGYKKETTPSPEFFSHASTLLEKLATAVRHLSHDRKLLVGAKDVQKTYKKGSFSLHPISLEISTGDILGVVGQNGNGKTTLLRCLAGQLALNDGHIRYHQLDHPDQYSIKQHVAFIPQRIPKWHGSLKDNLHFSASLSGVTGNLNDVMVDFMLERLDLTNFATLNWTQISSGYRTRFEIARILLQKPRLLILDEPLANLDINAQQTILTDLRYMAKSIHNPMGVILSSQQLHEVEKIADSVLLIKEGKCLFRTGEIETRPVGYVLELETTADREDIVNALGEEDTELHFNGGFYTVHSAQADVQQLIGRLIKNNIRITYFRDITHSTKRFFK